MPPTPCRRAAGQRRRRRSGSSCGASRARGSRGGRRLFIETHDNPDKPPSRLAKHGAVKDLEALLCRLKDFDIRQVRIRPAESPRFRDPQTRRVSSPLKLCVSHSHRREASRGKVRYAQVLSVSTPETHDRFIEEQFLAPASPGATVGRGRVPRQLWRPGYLLEQPVRARSRIR